MEHDYFPAASAHRGRAVNSGALGRGVGNWEQTLKQKWATLHFGDVKVQTIAVQHFFETEVHLNDLYQKAVRVELYADGINGSDPIRLDQLAGASGGYVYSATVSTDRPSAGYTARVIPYYAVVEVPLGAVLIHWHR